MIVYYTGTGNSKYVADKISAVTGDDVRNVTDFTKGNAPFELGDDEPLADLASYALQHVNHVS